MTQAKARDRIYRSRRFEGEIIELCVRWYVTYRLSYRDPAAMMAERGIRVSHTQRPSNRGGRLVEKAATFSW